MHMQAHAAPQPLNVRTILSEESWMKMSRHLVPDNGKPAVAAAPSFRPWIAPCQLVRQLAARSSNTPWAATLRSAVLWCMIADLCEKHDHDSLEVGVPPPHKNY